MTSTAVRRALWWLVVAALVVLLALEVVLVVNWYIAPNSGRWLGMDAEYYRSLGARWLANGSFFVPRQLAGPYNAVLLSNGPPDTLYPPLALALFVPAAVLPGILWWVVPVAVLLGSAASWRPAPAQVAVALAVVAWPRALGAFLFGNTDMWVAAFVAAGLRFGWPAVLVLLKPTMAPMALVGVRKRGWWLAAGALAASAVLAWPLWRDYVIAMANLRGLDATYSLGSLPSALVPVILWDRTSEAPQWPRARRRTRT